MEYDALVHYHFDTQQNNFFYQYSLKYLLLGKNDFTNNYPVFTHMHTFSLLGRMPLTSKSETNAVIFTTTDGSSRLGKKKSRKKKDPMGVVEGRVPWLLVQG
jgi:hypothetical protein